MKTLYLIRHAKSSWDDVTLHDFDRPLNERGKRDAPRMGKWLKENHEIPQLIISSPAKRAKKTAEKIAQEINYSESKIRWEKNLYETPIKTWLNIICQIENKFQSLALVAHNDTLTQMVNYLCDANVDNVPTCGMVKIEFDLNDWNMVSGGTGNLIWFQFPKNL